MVHQQTLTGAKLNWSTREKECYGIYFGCKTFEDLLDNRHFILKTDHMNLTFLNVDGNFICRIKTSTCAIFLERKFISTSLTHCCAFARTTCFRTKARSQPTSGIQPSWPLLSLTIAYQMRFLNKLLRCTTPWSGQFPRSWTALSPSSYANAHAAKTHPFTCTSYNSFESLNIDHIGPRPVDEKGDNHILVIINAFS